MIQYLNNSDDNSVAISMIQEMRELLIKQAAERWIVRQTYALVCSKLVSYRVITSQVFSKELLPYLLTLSNDCVPNVRLVVARTLVRDVLKNGTICKDSSYPY